MTEKQQFTAMLNRAGVGHGFRTDHQPPGETVMVQIENEDDSGVWHEVEFFFDENPAG